MAAKDRMEQFLEEHGNKVLVDPKLWESVKIDNRWYHVFLSDITLDMMLIAITERAFLRRGKELKKLMYSINMAQKAKLAYSLGIINKTALNDLERIHEIRNIFAHNFKTSFANTKVLKLVRRLSTAKGQEVEVTEKNSYKCYSDAITNCQDIIDAQYKEQTLKEAQGVSIWLGFKK